MSLPRFLRSRSYATESWTPNMAPRVGDLMFLPLTDPVPQGWTADLENECMWRIYDGTEILPAGNGLYVVRGAQVVGERQKT